MGHRVRADEFPMTEPVNCRRRSVLLLEVLEVGRFALRRLRYAPDVVLLDQQDAR